MEGHRTIAVISMLISSVCSCSLPKGWKPKSLEDRATLAEMVFYGKVIKSPTQWHFPDLGISPVLEKKNGFYSAEIEIYCIFRGDVVPRYVNISGFGYLPGHCLENHAIQEEKGIFFVRYGVSGELVSQTVNVQKGLSPVTSTLLMKVLKAVELSTKKVGFNRNSLFTRKKRGGCPVLIHHQA